MRRIVLSGAGGFLGRYIVREAEKRNVPVLAVTTQPEMFGEKTETLDTAMFLEGKSTLSESDVFIHCLFPTNADGGKMACGLKAAFSLIKAARNAGAGAFINISSQSVYASKREAPASEKTPLSLETPYAVGKFSTEVFTNEVFDGVPHTNVRLASLLGVEYKQRIVNRMIVQALNGEPLKVVGGMQRYGFLDVRDAAEGLVKLALSDAKIWEEIYNLGRNEIYTLIHVADCIVSEMKNQTGADVSYSILEGQDNRNSAVDASLFMKTFNWTPTVDLSETIATIICSNMT